MSAQQQSVTVDDGVLAGIRTTGTGRPTRLATLGLRRTVLELKTFFRNKESVIFTFAFPIMILVLFGAIFSGEVGRTGVDFRQYLVAGIMASGLVSVSFSTLAIGIAMEQGDGTLKRLAGTPMPKAAYFLGKLGMVLLTGIAEVAITLAIGVAAFDLDLPDTAAKWATFAWVCLLGISACSLMGIAYTRVIRNPKAAPAVVTPPYIALQFISGVYFVFSEIPGWLQTVAAVFPLKWMAQGLRSVFLPDSFASVEPAGGWELGRTALVLGAWCVAGFIMSAMWFRWRDRSNG
jgi:ABC-2 type transport system permease protein